MVPIVYSAVLLFLFIVYQQAWSTKLNFSNLKQVSNYFDDNFVRLFVSKKRLTKFERNGSKRTGIGNDYGAYVILRKLIHIKDLQLYHVHLTFFLKVVSSKN
jgi:hypothetical protein